ncbi:hypothetical protein FXF51_55815 [Nonomuraea sp. PA05]|uniref:hypothetical protein n=1 Tax=Nonomuraea sp. PA05 TaxID=2604466 RepID=UPI0011DBA8B3|nr:hypothetical protein [Nonomuraea sp. PA05]TYB50539.1 hypothetical protein FXF51_55815 [Nonomuraea sp. PA05]
MKVIFDSVHDLADALRRVAAAHASDSGPDLGSDWPVWYAHQMAALNEFSRFTQLAEPVRLEDTIAAYAASAPSGSGSGHGFVPRHASPDS